MKKLIIYTLVHLFIITSVIAQTQNSIWSLPPNYYNGSIQSLPTQPGTNWIGVPNYSTTNISTSNHAAMQDISGNLLFFVADGVAYNKDGFSYVFSEFIKNTTNYYPGHSEIMIVPDPGNCKRYYIFTTLSEYPTGPEANPSLIPGYAILDVETIDPNYSSTVARGLELNGLYPNTIFDFPNLSNAVFDGSMHYAATDLNTTTNSYFIFLENDGTIYRYKLDANGISYDGQIGTSLSTSSTTSGVVRGEMEVITTTTGYRLAITSAFEDNNSQPIVYKNAVAIFELNSSGVEVGTPEVLFYDQAAQSNPLANNFSSSVALKGLEFSPDGNYLYINRTKTTQFPATLEYYQIGSNIQPPNIPSITTTGNVHESFRLSQIELGSDGNLYFVNTSNMATLSNPNTPPGIFNPTAQTVSYNLFGGTGYGENILSYPLPDQIDGMDYTAHFTANLECCKDNSPYDVSSENNTHEYSGTHTWDATGSNPWGWVSSPNGVTIKDKLVIKSGANITINNMRFEFASNAELIVENGAILTIDGTTLTVDTRCGDAIMWKGVAVWGTGTGTNQSAVSGKFIAQNNSLIEHALEGASNYNYAASPSNANNGGIIKATTGTTFKNNLKDLVFKPYQSIVGASSQNDQSFFSDVTFKTDGSLNIPSLNNFIEHADLDNVTGIRFLGCDFENTDVTATTYTYLNRGVGITATDAKFTVDGRCTSMVFPCGSYDRSNFTNLTSGIYASNSTLRSQIASIKRCDFDDVWRSIYLNNMEPPVVILNTFDVGVGIYILTNLESYGLYLNNCSGYIVENNDFNTTHNGHFGVYVNNSGVAANEIYRNTFSNFIIASQAANTNGDNFGNGVGLEFRCNTYTNTTDYDILVSSGLVADDHGNCLTVTGPANNQFSYTATQGDFWAATASIGVPTYIYSPNGFNLEPRNGYYNTNTATHECQNLPNFNYANSCPDRQVPIIIFPPLLTLQNQHDSINNLMATKDIELLKVLEQDLAAINKQMQVLKNDSIRKLLEDNKTSDGKKEVISFLQQNKKYNTLSDEKLLTELLIAVGDITAAKSQLTDLQNDQNNEEFCNYNNIIIELNKNAEKINSLLVDSSLLQQIETISIAKQTDHTVAAAQSLLHYLNIINYKEPIEIINNQKSSLRLIEQEEANTTNNFSIYPNPTKEQFTLTHNYSLEQGSITLTIYDVMGRTMLTEMINDEKQTVNTTALKQGVYFYQITQNNQPLNNGKLVIE